MDGLRYLLRKEALLVVLGMLLAACGGTVDYRVSSFDVQRLGWDSLRVQVAFEGDPSIGAAQPTRPDSLALYLFDARYDTLYVGSSRRLAVPDADLGDAERLLVEACGQFGEQPVCEQRSLSASPKRLRTDAAQIAYPADDVDRGKYEVELSVERRRRGEAGWEEITPSDPIPTFLQAHVQGQEQAAVRVPLRRGQGRFTFAQHEGYEDFSYRLNSALYERDSAEVVFTLYARWSGDTTQVASMRRMVHPRGPEQQRHDIRHYARLASRQIIEELTGGEPDRARLHLRQWSYNEIARRYEVEMEVAWGGGFFGRDRRRLRGLLQVSRGGNEVRFRMKGGNREAKRQWERRVSRQVLVLDALPATPQLAEQEEREEQDRSRRLRGW